MTDKDYEHLTFFVRQKTLKLIYKKLTPSDVVEMCAERGWTTTEAEVESIAVLYWQELQRNWVNPDALNPGMSDQGGDSSVPPGAGRQR